MADIDFEAEDRVMAFGLAIMTYDSAREALEKASKEYDRLAKLVSLHERERAQAWAEHCRRIVKGHEEGR